MDWGKSRKHSNPSSVVSVFNVWKVKRQQQNVEKSRNTQELSLHNGQTKGIQFFTHLLKNMIRIYAQLCVDKQSHYHLWKISFVFCFFVEFFDSILLIVFCYLQEVVVRCRNLFQKRHRRLDRVAHKHLDHKTSRHKNLCYNYSLLLDLPMHQRTENFFGKNRAKIKLSFARLKRPKALTIHRRIVQASQSYTILVERAAVAIDNRFRIRPSSGVSLFL